MTITWRARYSTPFGVRWLSVKADTREQAKMLGTLKTPYRAGWVFEGVEEAKKPEAV